VQDHSKSKTLPGEQISAFAWKRDRLFVVIDEEPRRLQHTFGLRQEIILSPIEPNYRASTQFGRRLPRRTIRSISINYYQQGDAINEPTRRPLLSYWRIVVAKIGNDSRTMRRDGEAPVRVVFDLGARRKPQAFAADAVSLWVFNRSLVILNELLLYSIKLMKRSYPNPGPSMWHYPASAAPAASVLSANRKLCRS
jgi:hypothetical protein